MESSHAFLKSAYVAAFELFPGMRLIHLVRSPLCVANSERYREEWRRRVHAPFHFYRGDDGRRHFCWALTGNEAIFQHFERSRLSLFQWYLLQWIEVENRAMRFLDAHNLHQSCFTLDSSKDLNNASKLKEMFDFLELPLVMSSRIIMGRPRNHSLGHKNIITAENERECEEILRQVPPQYLEIFSREPYRDLSLNTGFLSHATGRSVEYA